MRMAEHDRRRVVGRERLDRILERLTLVDCGATGLDRNDVGREPLGGELERRRSAGARLVEQGHHGLAAQGRHLLDFTAGDLGKARGPFEDRLDQVAVELFHSEQVPHSTTSTGLRIDYAFGTVGFHQADRNRLVAGGRQVLADEVRADRQFPVATIAEHRKLDARRPAVIEERVDRGPDGAAGEKDVVDQDYGAVFEREVEPGRVDHRLAVNRAGLQIVSVEGDVDLADRNLDSSQFEEQALQAFGETTPRVWMPTTATIRDVGVLLDDLVRYAAQRARDIFGFQYLFLAHCDPSRPLRTWLKNRSSQTITRPRRNPESAAGAVFGSSANRTAVDQVGLALLGQRQLDQVEVARCDRVGNSVSASSRAASTW